MATNCFSVVRGKRVRVTRVNGCGVYPVPTTTNSLVTSSGFISVQYALDYEDGDEHIQKNANGDLCINDRSCDVFKRVMVTISLCEVDPDLFSLVTNNTIEVDSSGNDVGFRISEGVACSDFALELWSGVDDEGDCGLTNEVQSATEGGSGLTSFTLTATIPGYSPATTGSIAAAATAAQVQAALEALDGIDPGDVSVSGPTSGPYIITFQGRLAGLNIAQTTSTPTGGTGTVTMATVTGGGVSQGAEFGYFLLPHVKNGTLRDFTVENGPTTFEIQGWTDQNSWGSGPYNVVASGAGGVPSALDDPLVQKDHLVARTTLVPPPAAVCGYQAMPAAPTPAV